jgi:hypothetical protein
VLRNTASTLSLSLMTLSHSARSVISLDTKDFAAADAFDIDWLWMRATRACSTPSSRRQAPPVDPFADVGAAWLTIAPTSREIPPLWHRSALNASLIDKRRQLALLWQKNRFL